MGSSNLIVRKLEVGVVINSAVQGLRRLDILGNISSIVYKGSYLCEFLLAFLLTEVFSKRCEFAPEGCKFNRFRLDPLY